MAKKHPILALIFFISCGGIGIASWQIGLVGNITGKVISFDSEVLSWNVAFADVDLNTSVSAVEVLLENDIINLDGNMSFLADLEVTKKDDADGCTDYTDDCDVAFLYEGNEISDNDVILIGSGASDFDINMTCIKNSCPGTIDVNVTLTQV